MYHTIPVPWTGSERAEAVLPRVEDLARRYGAAVSFSQVVEPAPFTAGYGPSHVTLREDLERRAEQAESHGWETRLL